MNLKVETIPFKDHNGELKDKIEGQRVVLLVDENGDPRGELVWRIASGYTVEICEFGIHREEDRRHGWGTKLLDEGLNDMREYFRNRLTRPHRFHRVWLLAEARNLIARVFYKARGFQEEAVLKDFYTDGDAVLCVMEVQNR